MSAGKKKWGFGGKAPQGPFHTSQEDVSCTCSHPLSLLKSKKLCPIFHHTQNVTRGAPRGAPGRPGVPLGRPAPLKTLKRFRGELEFQKSRFLDSYYIAQTPYTAQDACGHSCGPHAEL